MKIAYRNLERRHAQPDREEVAGFAEEGEHAELEAVVDLLRQVGGDATPDPRDARSAAVERG